MAVIAAEFEFSYPTDLSPSLFTANLPFDELTGNLISPSGSSFPALSLNGGDSPAPTSLDPGHHPPRPSAPSRPSKRLFEEEERSALDAFFSETLGEPSELPDRPSTSEVAESASKRRRSSAGSRPRVAKRPTPPVIGQSQRIEEEAVQTTPEADMDADADADADADEPPVKEEDADADYIADGPSAPTRSTRPKALAAPTSKKKASPIQTSKGTTSAASKRSNHIASEQRRRTTIKDNYKSLVDLLLAGEASSGISLQASADDDDEDTGKGKKGKPKGRGRGRKGQDGAGATKSVVLEKAADYLRWLERGNTELKNEIARFEALSAR